MDTIMAEHTSSTQMAHTTPTQATQVHPFYNLPSELILDIIDLLAPDSFINFAFANYPLLLRRGLVPQLSSERVAALVSRTNINRHFQLLPFPAEIIMHIISLLKPIDMMRFVLANYAELERQGIAPSLTPTTLTQLMGAIPFSSSQNNM